MIRVAGRKPSRISRLAENLAFERFLETEKKANLLNERRQLFAEIAPYTRDKNTKTAQAALALQQALLKEEASYRKIL